MNNKQYDTTRQNGQLTTAVRIRITRICDQQQQQQQQQQ
jgi:hypothetical protein